MLDGKNRATLIRYPVCIPTSVQPVKYRDGTAVTAQGRSCRYKDPSLQFPEGILPHRCICQGNKGSPPSAACQGQEFRTDNLLSRPLSAQPQEEVMRLFPLAANCWA